MNVKYQIFVSLTTRISNERNEVIKACLNMGHIPVGMEMFNAADEKQCGPGTTGWRGKVTQHR
jgi:Domain of unknown function (DUF4062)